MLYSISIHRVWVSDKRPACGRRVLFGRRHMCSSQTRWDMSQFGINSVILYLYLIHYRIITRLLRYRGNRTANGVTLSIDRLWFETIDWFFFCTMVSSKSWTKNEILEICLHLHKLNEFIGGISRVYLMHSL